MKKYFLLFVLLCIASPSLANQEIVDNIKDINIDGVTVETKMSDAGNILSNSGYKKNEVGTRLPHLLHYDKGNCRIQITGEETIHSISYVCKGNERAQFVKVRLLTFCAIEDKVIKVRKGCTDKFPFAQDTFES